MTHKKNNQEGIALIAALLLVSIILTMALTLSAIFIPKIESVTQIRQSVAAAYAAESALEWCLYVNRVTTVPSPAMGNNTKFVIEPDPCLLDLDQTPLPSPYIMKSTGSDLQDKVVRAFEARYYPPIQ
jgi:hypothetical protein